MTCDPAVAPAGDACDVLAHVLFQVSGRDLHCPLFGPFDGGQRRLIDARPSLQPGQAHLVRLDRLGESGHALGVDGVLVDPALSLSLRLDGRLALLLCLGQELLGPHPGGGRVLRHAPESGQGVTGLIHLGGGPITLCGKVATHGDARQDPPLFGSQLVDGGGVGRLPLEECVPGIDIGDSQRCQDRIPLAPSLLQLLGILLLRLPSSLELHLLKMHLSLEVAAASPAPERPHTDADPQDQQHDG